MMVGEIFCALIVTASSHEVSQLTGSWWQGKHQLLWQVKRKICKGKKTKIIERDSHGIDESLTS